LVLNWKPEPEFGGFYAADYSKHGLDIAILPGGAGTPTVQMIGAASAEFGIVLGDEILTARARGNDVVALFAVFQQCPVGIMVHASRKLESIGDVVKKGTLALQGGLPYGRLLQKKYGFDKVKIVPSPGGDLTAFLNDENFAQQCFITSEPLAARALGLAVKVFPISDMGYNPYSQVMATRGETLRRQPKMVGAMVAAVREGWRAYLDNPQPTNQRMHDLNPSMDLTTFANVAEAQKPLIDTDVLGKMTKERWETLALHLKELGDIPQVSAAEGCFRTDA
jgi:NitT/TauT family transport system substrate-binding protein